MASNSRTGEDPPRSPAVENSTLVTMEATMIVATGRDHCQQLKHMLCIEDPSSMVVVMASSKLASKPSPPKPRSPGMNCRLLASACSGSFEDMKLLLNGDDRLRSGNMNIGSSADDEEALFTESILDGVTVGGNTILHVVAGAAGNSDSGDMLKKADLIHNKIGDLLFVQNNNGDTPLHCAARACNSPMVSLLIDLAKGQENNANRVKALLETENKSKWTVLHEAVHARCIDIVELLMEEDPQLASFPENGTSTLYLAILLESKILAKTLHEMSTGLLSYSGPNGKNALHAAVLRGKDLTKMLLGWNNTLTIQQDENGSTPLHLAASVLGERDQRLIRLLLLDANPDVLYQPDNDGLCPIHVAASVDATLAITDFLRKSPCCAGLRDAGGRTFLHIAVDRMTRMTIMSASRNQSLTWILNMQDNDGNTALHLAAQKGSLTIFCALFGNRQVHLSLPNQKGETPLDIARRNLRSKQMYYNQNSEAIIVFALKFAKAEWGIYRHDYFKKQDIVQASQEKEHKMQMVKDSTQNLSICSVLIATITFGATFAMPGGYRADDHANAGTPTLSGRYAFNAFILANALAFAFSVVAVISLMCSGTPLYGLRSRVVQLGVAFPSMDISVKCLVAAFATGTYVMLSSVAHKSAVTVCVLSSLVLLNATLDVAIKSAMVIPAIWWRRGICQNKILMFPLSVLSFVGAILFNLWPIVVILSLTALNYTCRKVEPAAQPPTPSG